MRRERIRRAVDVVLIGLFLGAITIPMVAQVTGLRVDGPTHENRPLARLPVVRATFSSLQALPAAFGRWYGVHFGLRETLVRWHNRVRAAVGVSGVAGVVLGRDGWLFLDQETDMVDQYRGLRTLDRVALADWRRALAARREWLAARGIDYLLVVVPEKHTIYPEYMPRHLTRVREVTPLDEWMRHVARADGTPVLDLRQVLGAAKRGPLVYQRTDSHWSSVGAYLGYRAIVTALAERHRLPLATRDLDAFRLVSRTGPGGDLARMLALEDVYRETRDILVPREPWRARRIEVGTWRGRTTRVYETGERHAGRAVVFHDSFGLALMPYLSEHFGRTVYVHERNVLGDLIDAERPDVVVQEIAERVLVVPPRDELTWRAGAPPGRRSR